MLAIWHLRPALQRRFPLYSGNERCHVAFLAWCFTHGRKDYRILRELPEWDTELNSPASLPPVTDDAWHGGFSVAMVLYAINRYRDSFSGLLRGRRARRRIGRGFWRGFRHAAFAPSPGRWQKAWILERFGGLSAFADHLRLEKERGMTVEDLIEQFGLHDLQAPSGEDASTKPVEMSIRLARCPLPLPLSVARWSMPVKDHLTRRAPTEGERAAVTRLIDCEPPEPRLAAHQFGVNLIGFARGELGIGEDIRQVAFALEAEAIPVCILDFAPGKNISTAEDGAARFLSETPRYGINIFCLTGIETTRFACERGLSTLEGRYNIGLWPWELPDWPESCRHAYACVDEIWGISEYTAHAHRFAAPRPVLPMGLPVSLGPVGPQKRQDFGLPEDACLYCFAFDINSSAARKNPEGVITAFQKAFPRNGSNNVGLVLKISHPETGCKLWHRIRRAARRDPRIHLVERTMRRPELLALFNACDCFVSLHRAEGFGRCVAEALLLGKQVITTGFSGNTDFCHEPRAALVRHRMAPLAAGDYMWGEGQSWAEPDLDHAAELMRQIKEQPRAVNDCEFEFAPAKVGSRYADRLHSIWREHRAP